MSHNNETCDQETEFASGNIYIRKNLLLKKGDLVDGHKHKFDHTTIVFKGGVKVKRVSPEGVMTEVDFMAPSHFLVEKDSEHEITALVDDTEFWCVYSHRDAQGEVVQEMTGWPQVRDTNYV